MAKQGRDDAALRGTTVGSVELPVFKISGFQEASNKINDLSVSDLPTKQIHDNAVVNIVEVADNIDLDEPFRSSPHLLNVLQCGMAGEVARFV